MSKHGSCNFRIGSKSFRTARKRLHMPDCACQSTLECVANKRFVGTSLPLTDQTLRICSSGRTWSKKAIRCSSASERPHVKARSAAGPISRSRSGGMADLVGHRGRNGEEEASQGAGSPLNEGLGRALRWDLRERWLTVLSAQNAHSVRPSSYWRRDPKPVTASEPSDRAHQSAVREGRVLPIHPCTFTAQK